MKAYTIKLKEAAKNTIGRSKLQLDRQILNSPFYNVLEKNKGALLYGLRRRVQQFAQLQRNFKLFIFQNFKTELNMSQFYMC